MARTQIDLRTRMLDHLAKAEVLQAEAKRIEGQTRPLAEEKARSHMGKDQPWFVHQEYLLQQNPHWRRATSLRDVHQKMTTLYATVLLALNSGVEPPPLAVDLLEAAGDGPPVPPRPRDESNPA